MVDDAIRRALRSGQLDDSSFDALHSAPVRRVASRFWTPLAVAGRVARLLEQWGARRVLDAGSGSGKFCIAAAALYPGAHFTGIEQRPHLVAEARAVAARLRVDNASFLVGDATRFAADTFEAVYFFNPFAENISGALDEHYDVTVELSESRFTSDVLHTELALERARKDFVLVTYYGYGGRIPGNYELIHSERIGTDWIRAWRKRDDDRALGRWYVDQGERVWFVETRRALQYVERVPVPARGAV